MLQWFGSLAVARGMIATFFHAFTEVAGNASDIGRVRVCSAYGVPFQRFATLSNG